jgi:hypothetical protein
MSQVEIATCEFIKEVESSAREARRKGGEDPSGPSAMAYHSLSLELRKLVHRHISRSQCSACHHDEKRRHTREHMRPSTDLAFHDHLRPASTMGVTQ